jgi:transcriptional regulator with XRE-family HTH domain
MVPASPARLLRLRRGLSQAAVARELGVAQQGISFIELGQRRLTGPTFARLCAFYGCAPERLRRQMLAWRRATRAAEPSGKARAA